MDQSGSVGVARLLRARAGVIALAWSEAASATTTLGRERAILRLLGVAGSAASGRPLALEVAHRYFSADPGRLAHGIGLPFAAQLLADGSTPVALARAVADGSVDLGSSLPVSADPAARAAALQKACELAAATLERMDANRTARGELRTMLGEPSHPMLGASLASVMLGGTAKGAGFAVDLGADLVMLADASESDSESDSESEPGSGVVAARSKRGLAGLRSQLDEAGAVRGRYVRLGVEIDVLSADQAVVAGLERADLVLADPMTAIVAGLASPGHAIADHLFACRVLARAGLDLLVPAGPLVVAPDIQSGIGSTPAVRSGRALAIQLLAVALAEAAGVARSRITVAGLPAWLADEPGAIRLAVAELAARRVLFDGSAVALVEPEGLAEAAAGWRVLTAMLLADGGIDLVIVGHDDATGGLAMLRDGIAIAADVRASRHPGGLSQTAADHRDAILEAAGRELASLEHGGWAAIMGDPLEAAAGEPRSGVALRTDGFNPLG